MLRPAFAIFAQQYLSALLGDFGSVYLNEPIPRDPNLRIFKHPSRSDWGTEFLKGVTAGNNRIMVSPEVIGEAELVDVLFEPNAEKSRTSLGLLGKLTSVPSIIEILRWAPDAWDLRTCLRHWLAWKAEANKSIIPVDQTSVNKKKKNNQLEKDKKASIVIVPSIAPENLKGMNAKPSVIKIPGVYDLAPVFCSTIIATSELPQNPSTLWLRVLGRGQTQRAAIMELIALDINHPHRAIALQQLQQWYQLLLDGQMGKESKRLMQTLAIANS
jgi:hypothetical protein